MYSLGVVRRSLDFLQTVPIPVKQTAFQRRRLVDADGYDTKRSTVLPPESAPAAEVAKSKVGVFSAVLIGIAAAVIVCAAVLLITDVQDRLRFEKMMQEDGRDSFVIHRLNNPTSNRSMANKRAERRIKEWAATRENSNHLPDVPAMVLEYPILPPVSEIEEEAVLADVPVDGPESEDAQSLTSTIFLEDCINKGARTRPSIEEAGTLELSAQDLVKDLSDLGKLILTNTLLTKKTDSFTTGGAGSNDDAGSSDSNSFSAVANTEGLPVPATEISETAMEV